MVIFNSYVKLPEGNIWSLHYLHCGFLEATLAMAMAWESLGVCHSQVCHLCVAPVLWMSWPTSRQHSVRSLDESGWELNDVECIGYMLDMQYFWIPQWGKKRGRCRGDAGDVWSSIHGSWTPGSLWITEILCHLPRWFRERAIAWGACRRDNSWSGISYFQATCGARW